MKEIYIPEKTQEQMTPIDNCIYSYKYIYGVLTKDKLIGFIDFDAPLKEFIIRFIKNNSIYESSVSKRRLEIPSHFKTYGLQEIFRESLKTIIQNKIKVFKFEKNTEFCEWLKENL